MTGARPPGPWEMLSIGDEAVPLYVLPFDSAGVPQAPRTAEQLRQTVAGGGATDLIVMSHGWNTDWNGALDLYRRFTAVYHGVVKGAGAPRPGARTVVLGVSWPSIALPSSTAPMMAAIMAPTMGEAPADELDVAELTALAETVVAADDRAEFYALAQSDSLDGAAAPRFAQLLAPLYDVSDGDLSAASTSDGATSGEETVSTWAAIRGQLDGSQEPLVVSGPGGPPSPGPAAAPAGPGAAGLPEVLDPRNIVRLATVLMMKDRAGVVGARGVGPVLRGLLDTPSDVRIHLVGHSYGCKVVLSALCAAPVPRPARSALLLQAAISYLALADTVPGLDRPAGYQPAKAGTELPIMATWTDQDVPLRNVFSLAVRRRSDLGEQDIGAASELPLSRYAAMGGWGPADELGVRNERIRTPDQGRYQLTGAEVLSLNSRNVITGHGDIVRDATGWALYNLVAEE